MMVNLAGKKILLIASKFFGYEQEITKELIRCGAEVDFIQDRPVNSAFMKAIMRYCKPLVAPYAEKFFREKISEFKSTHYDYLFVVKGEGLTANTLKFIKSKFPKIISLCYFWDSQQNRGNILSLLGYFNKVYTFDPLDVTKHNLEYRPLFFSSQFLIDPQCPIDYDISFVGTCHSDRYKVIADVRKSIGSNRVFFAYLFLQSKWLFYIYKILKKEYKGSKLDEFSFAALSLKDVANIFWRSFAVLDIEHPNQSGLTMRTFEAMAAGKKLITTNATIKNADFYSENNIFVVTRGIHKDIPDDFFERPFQKIPDALMYKYSIGGWISDIFKDCES